MQKQFCYSLYQFVYECQRMSGNEFLAIFEAVKKVIVRFVSTQKIVCEGRDIVKGRVHKTTSVIGRK